MKQQPRLVYSVLGGRVYVVTRYHLKEGKRKGEFLLRATTKYDVTDDFVQLRLRRVRIAKS